MNKKEKRWDDALLFAIQAAIGGGRIAFNYFRQSDLDVQLKGDGSPVTRADKAADGVIVPQLMKFDQNSGILSEETGEHGLQSHRWIVDPLDATKNFIRGIPFWAILIAYEEDGEIVVAVVYEPANGGNLFTARKGAGAFLNGHPIRVSDVSELPQALLLHGSVRSFLLGDAKRWATFTELLRNVGRARGLGDYTNYTWLAQGLGDVTFDAGLKRWDIAAPSLIVTEARGTFSFDAESGLTFATNGKLADEFHELIGK